MAAIAIKRKETQEKHRSWSLNKKTQNSYMSNTFLSTKHKTKALWPNWLVESAVQKGGT